MKYTDSILIELQSKFFFIFLPVTFFNILLAAGMKNFQILTSRE